MGRTSALLTRMDGVSAATRKYGSRSSGGKLVNEKSGDKVPQLRSTNSLVASTRALHVSNMPCRCNSNSSSDHSTGAAPRAPRKTIMSDGRISLSLDTVIPRWAHAFRTVPSKWSVKIVSADTVSRVLLRSVMYLASSSVPLWLGLSRATAQYQGLQVSFRQT